MIARGLGGAAGRTVTGIIGQSKYIVTALGRTVVPLPGIALLNIGLAGLGKLPAGTDKAVWVVITAAGAILFILLLRWLAAGAGILWGLWLWLLSAGLWYGFVLGPLILLEQLVAALFGRLSFDPGYVMIGIFGLVLLALCSAGLRRAERSGRGGITGRSLYIAAGAYLALAGTVAIAAMALL